MSPRPRIALVTFAALPDLGPDAALVPAMRRFGAVDVAAWDDPAVDWSGYDLVVVRSTWNYLLDLPAFLDWADEVGRRTRLLNSAAVLRWNVDKRYLADLAAAGVPVVPTRFVVPDAPDAVEAAVAAYVTPGAPVDVVVKPGRSAGARGAGRFADPVAAAAHARELLRDGQTVLVQPYLDSVDTRWETGTYLAGGVVTHAVRKRGLLRAGAAPTDDFSLGAGQEIVPAAPDPVLVDFARRVLAAVPLPSEEIGYARVDVVDGPRGPLLIELELIEPGLFLDRAPQAADRFAEALWAFARPRL